MADQLRIRRTITVTVSGPQDLVNAACQQMVMAVTMEPGPPVMRWRIEQGIDILDEHWQVVPAAEIVAAAIRDKEAKAHEAL